MFTKIHTYLKKKLWVVHLIMFLLLILLFSISKWYNSAHAAELETCAEFIPYGMPTEKHGSTILCKRGFLISYANEAKIPFWVSYTLTPEKSVGCEPRQGFHDDTELNYRYQSHQRDYSGSGFDIGHNVNAADMAYSKESSYDSFLMSNMSPQLPGFNRGIWKKLETQVRDWAWNNSYTIYAGNIWNDKSDTIGPNRVIVPDSMFKMIINNETHEYIIFEFPHTEKEKKLNNYIITLSELENHTGITFPIPNDGKEINQLWPSIKGREEFKRKVCKEK